MGMWHLSKNKPRTFMMMGWVVKHSFNLGDGVGYGRKTFIQFGYGVEK
jgi:hypothetical protein